ncbi:MAG TPA: hypothetical protein VNK24_02655, partial [Elusimicrobiota bacterium]|nr:hypothetical protein [Elusimicrobiota bacterium]
GLAWAEAILKADARERASGSLDDRVAAQFKALGGSRIEGDGVIHMIHGSKTATGGVVHNAHTNGEPGSQASSLKINPFSAAC